MKVILLKDVKGIGRAGELVTASDGHAMNFLMPKKLAVQATPQELAKYETRKKHDAQKTERLAKIAETIAAEPLVFSLKTGVDGAVFSSIGKNEIESALLKRGCTAQRIDLEKPIRALGEHAAVVHLGKGIEAKITVKTVGDK